MPSGPTDTEEELDGISVQVAEDGRRTRRAAEGLRAQFRTGARATRSRSARRGRCAWSAFATMTQTNPRCWSSRTWP